MAGLYGVFHNSVDAKGRVSLPSKFRRVLPDSLVVVTSLDTRFPQLEIYSEEGFDAYRQEFFEPEGGYKKNNLKHRDLMSKLNSRASSVDVDSAGRISIPPKRRADAKIGDEAVMVGDGDCVRVFDVATYDAYQAYLDTIDAFE
jgi:MraZ protein